MSKQVKSFILKAVDTFVTFVTTSRSLTLSITGFVLSVESISTRVSRGLILTKEVSNEIYMKKIKMTKRIKKRHKKLVTFSINYTENAYKTR